jgi:hypothetical protein
MARRAANVVTMRGFRGRSNRNKQQMAGPRDFQRKRVYDAERDLFPVDRFPPDLSLWECEQLLHRMYRDARYQGMEKARSSVPVLKDGRGRRRAGYSRPKHVISLPRSYRKAWVVAHEVAHTLVDHNRVPGHGEEFMAVYIDLLERYCGLDGAHLRGHFADRGVRMAAFVEVLSGKATALAA